MAGKSSGREGASDLTQVVGYSFLGQTVLDSEMTGDLRFLMLGNQDFGGREHPIQLQ